MERRFAREICAAGAAGATGAAGNTGYGNGAIYDDADNDAGAPDGVAAAGGDVTVIPTMDRKTSGRRGFPRQ